jgi:hypothetical protein
LENQLKDVEMRFGKYLGDMRGALVNEVTVLREKLTAQMRQLCGVGYAITDKSKVVEEERANAGGVAHGSAVALGHATSSSTVQDNNAGGPGGQPSTVLGASVAGIALRDLILTPEGKQNVEILHVEINETTEALTRLQNLHKYRFAEARQECEHQLQSFKTGLTSHVDLWEKCAAMRESAHIIEDELGSSHTRVTAANEAREKLNAQAQRESERGAKLEQWKAEAYKSFDVLSKEERKYERVDNVDIHKLEHDLMMLDHKILECLREPMNRNGDSRLVERQQGEARMANVKHNTLRAKIKKERLLTQKANAKSDLIRREIECGETFEDESLIGLLADDFRRTSEAIQLMEEENEALRQTVQTKSMIQQGTMVGKVQRRAAIKNTAFKDVQKTVKKHALRERSQEENLCYSVIGTTAVLPLTEMASPLTGGDFKISRSYLPPLEEELQKVDEIAADPVAKTLHSWVDSIAQDLLDLPGPRDGPNSSDSRAPDATDTIVTSQPSASGTAAALARQNGSGTDGSTLPASVDHRGVDGARAQSSQSGHSRFTQMLQDPAVFLSELQATEPRMFRRSLPIEPSSITEPNRSGRTGG